MRRLAVGALVAGFCALAVGRALSQPFPRKDVPPALGPWVAWALDGAEDKLCPAVKGAAVCLWPGRLSLKLDASGGTFSEELAADRALHAPLPGGARSWPQDVRLDGRPAAVLTHEGRPAVWLEAGAHRVEGRFAWSRMPDSLAVPPRTALVDLSVAGHAVPFPPREEDGLLILRQEAGGSGKEEELRLKVFRRLTDGIPLWLETRIQLEVSGRAREVRLAGALTPHAVPIAVRGELPARLDADGALRVQVRPGRFAVDVLCRLDGNVAKVERGPGEAPWPPQEIWVFAANEKLRQVEVSGAAPIDPARTDLPEGWRALPAFVLDAGGALALREARRGEPDASPDRISLARTLWLDLDGRGFSVRDRFAGVLGRTTRLDLARPGELGRVAVDGRDQLVTASPAGGAPGVELRKASLDLLGDSRLPRAAALPAVGWNANVQSLRVALELPPGWSLLAARGVDRAPTAWLSRWTLFGFFLVVLVAAAVARLAGWRFGLVALATLALSYREPGAPELVWVSLLASGALLGVARGRLLTLVKAWWVVSALALVLIALPFFLREVRGGLFPQTRGGAAVGAQAGFEGDIETFDAKSLGIAKKAGVAPPQVEAAEKAPASPGGARGAQVAQQQEPSSVTELQQLNVLSYSKAKQETYEQDPHAVIQTGPGVPAWRWRTAALEWSGPVAKEQVMRLFLISPAANLVLAFLRVGLVTLLGARLLSRERERFRIPAGSLPIAPLALVLVLGAGPARTQQVVPSDEILGELRDRLTRPFPCAPACVETPSASVTVKGGELTVAADVHAGAPAGWAIPGPASEWVPRAATVDRAPAAMARLSDGFLYVRLAPGVHRVEVTGPLPAKDSLALQLPDRPRRVTVAAEGWQVDGVRDDGATDGSIQLTRKLKGEARGASAEARYEPWFEVVRSFDIGVSWSVETIVRRISPPGVPVVLRVPLLKGMLTTGDEEVKDGEVVVTMGRDQTEAHWSSTLRPIEKEPITLKAPDGRPWSEVWVLRCGPVWECAATGIPPVARQQGDLFVGEFRPWPGESLALSFQRPQGIDGQTVTIDSVALDARPGRRLSDASLDLAVRASRASPLVLTLPKGAEVQELTIGGAKHPIRPEGTKVTLTVEAGRHDLHLAFREPHGIGVLQRAPSVELGQPAVNASVVLHVPEGRWLLLAGGPRWGPAVLFWGELLLVLLAAALLGRLPLSPLATWQWILLALGLAQLSALACVLAAGWFLALALRERKTPESPRAHDLLQILLVLWTLVFFVLLYAAVRQGLLLQPDMQVAGNASTDSELRWYQDRIAGGTPAAWVVSLPLFVYKLVMLAWSLWLAGSLITWLKWAFRAFTSGGAWRPVPARAPENVPPIGSGPPPVPREPPPVPT